jgi:hypothetical protein
LPWAVLGADCATALEVPKPNTHITNTAEAPAMNDFGIRNI